MSFLQKLPFLTVISALWPVAPLLAATPTNPHPVTVQDSVLLRRFEPGLTLSPNGQWIAYVLREPQPERDFNEHVLYIVPVPAKDAPPTAKPGRGRELFRTGAAGFQFPSVQFQWLADSKGLIALHQPFGEPRPIVSRVDIATGRVTELYRSEQAIADFAANERGDRLVVATVVPDSGRLARFRTTRGVVMTPDDDLANPRGWALWQDHDETDDVRQRELRIVEPKGASVVIGRFEAAGLTLSPDGRHLAFVVGAREAGIALPAGWQKDVLAKRHGDNPKVVALISLPATLPTSKSAVSTQSGSTAPWPIRLGFDGPRASVVKWSDDSSSYIVVGPRPIGDGGVARSVDTISDELRESSCLYSVDVKTGAPTQLMDRPETGGFWNRNRKVLAFDEDAKRVLIRIMKGDLVTLRRSSASAAWKEEKRIVTEQGIRGSEEFTATNGSVLVGLAQTTMTPPDLYVMDLATNRKTVLTEINPELRMQKLSKVETIEWTENGGRFFGHIVYPVDFIPGRRYPCAILAKSWDRSSFIHEDQDGYRAGNFPAQALAAQGILVFMSGNPEGGSPDMDVPQGSQVHRRYYGARRELDQRGLIDPARCGVMGFSHTSFEVSFLVTHPGPDPQWAAAISVDGFTSNNYATVFAVKPAREVLTTLEWKSFGFGPGPDGGTIDAKLPLFLERSSAWNAQHTRTPLLLRRHGSSPLPFAEIYSALWSRGKPVELVWYVDGAHTLKLPSERESSMQQVVDWFCFWLQGTERPNVTDDSGRFARWRELREQHRRNEQRLTTTTAQAITPK